jgi:hypothetical protein
MGKRKFATDIQPGKRQKVTPLEEVYDQFYVERKCKNCQMYKESAYSSRVGICLQRGCVVSGHWDCILDADGKLKVTRQKVVR